jgi:hypothetical protein
MASNACDCKVALLDVLPVIDWPESMLARLIGEAERLGIPVDWDWARRVAVSVPDAAELVAKVKGRPVLDAAQARAQLADSEQTWTLPPVRRRDGTLVPAVTRPGDSSSGDRDVLDWRDAPW